MSRIIFICASLNALVEATSPSLHHVFHLLHRVRAHLGLMLMLGECRRPQDGDDGGDAQKALSIFHGGLL
jgi:hypothetical protein